MNQTQYVYDCVQLQMKKAIWATFGLKSNNCSLIGSKSSATLPPNSSYKIESNNGDDEGLKLVLGERNIANIFLPHEVAIVKKLLSHAQVVEKDLGPIITSLGKETT